MNAEKVQTMISEGIPEAQVNVSGDDGVHFEAVIICQEFNGMPTIRRHRMVYATLGKFMGREIHALSLKTLTPAEHAAQNS